MIACRSSSAGPEQAPCKREVPGSNPGSGLRVSSAVATLGLQAVAEIYQRELDPAPDRPGLSVAPSTCTGQRCESVIALERIRARSGGSGSSRPRAASARSAVGVKVGALMLPGRQPAAIARRLLSYCARPRPFEAIVFHPYAWRAAEPCRIRQRRVRHYRQTSRDLALHSSRALPADSSPLA